MTGRGRRGKNGGKRANPVEPFKLVTPLDSSPFSHFLPKSMTKPEWPTMDPEQPPEKPSPPPKKRKRAEIPQWREYPKRARKEITYADAEDSDDSAFYGSDDNDEDVAALKVRFSQHPQSLTPTKRIPPTSREQKPTDPFQKGKSSPSYHFPASSAT